MESVKKSIDERSLHKREYDTRVNERQIQTTYGNIDTGNALDASLVNTESIGTESKEQDTSSRSGNDAHADDADIRPIYDEEPMAENVEQCHDTCPLPAKVNDNQTTELTNQSLEFEDIYVIETINIELEHKVAQLLKENETLKRHYKEMFDSIKTKRAKNIEHTTSLIAKNDEFKAQLQERGFEIAALKNELRKLTRNSVNTKFAKSSILGRPILQPHRNQSVVRKPTMFKSERPRISKPKFASQVYVNNDLPKPVTTHYLPRERESAFAKPHHMIAPGLSRYSSNDMVHNHYLEEAKKQSHEIGRNSKPSMMLSARSQSTANGSKPKPRINNQKSRNWIASKSSCIMTKTVPLAEHSRNFRKFSDSKHFVCSTCQKCVFNANHDSCVIKFLNEVNSRAKKLTDKIFKRVGLRWVPTGKIFTSSTTKVDNEPTNGLNDDITNPYECKQTLDVSAGTLNLSTAMTSDHNSSELGIHYHSNEQSSSKLVPNVVPLVDKTATSKQELELLFHHHITMLRSTCGQGIMPTKIELTLEQSQQGVSNEVLNIRVILKVFTVKMEILLEPTSNKLLDSYKDADGDASFQLKSDSLPHAHAQTTKTYYKHQDSRIKKAQVLNTKTSANSDKQDLPLRYQVYQERSLKSFQEDAKYEHVGRDTRSQGGKDDQD
ncbi:hypothetical protein Tco_0281628 [Tanacetum coccineum]